MRWRKVSKCCCASTVVGVSTATCLPSITALNAARIATSVLPKPDVAANQPVHRARLLHVALGRVDGFELIGRLAKRKRMLEFALPFCVGAEGVAELRFALRLDGQHLAGVIENRSRGVGFRARPFRIRERTERWRFFPDADVAGNEIGLLQRNVETRFVGKLQRQHFLLAAADRRHFHELEETAHAVLEVNHEIAFVQFAEIDLRAIPRLLFGALQSAPSVRGRAAEEFGRGKHDQIRRLENKIRAPAFPPPIRRPSSDPLLASMISRKRSISPSVWK